jgi:dihydrolipoamide dehydrogenase
VATTAAEADKFGVGCGDIVIDYPAAISRMQSVVGGLRDGIAQLLSGVEIIYGEATLIGGRKIEVNAEQIEAAKRLVIATGSRPAIPPIEGAEFAMTSDDVLSCDKLPTSVVIIGGGVIGMEFASIFNSLGVETTVVEYCDEILPPFDAEIAKRLRSMLNRRKVKINVGCAVKKIEMLSTGHALVSYEGKKRLSTIEAEKVIMAVGRKPVVPTGVDAAGIAISPRGFIEVDENMRTNIDGVYAIGDVNGKSMLAHSAIAQARVIASNNPEAFNPMLVPSIVFTSPEVAAVGPTPKTLDEQGIEYYEQKRMFASNGKACAMGENQGFIKLICRKSDDTLIATSVIGPHAADLIAEATILIAEHIKLEDIPMRYIHAHPTISEIFC